MKRYYHSFVAASEISVLWSNDTLLYITAISTPNKDRKVQGMLSWTTILLHLMACLTKKSYAQVMDAIISHGCFLRECSVERSIVGVRSRLDFGVELKVCFRFTELVEIPSYGLAKMFLIRIMWFECCNVHQDYCFNWKESLFHHNFCLIWS